MSFGLAQEHNLGYAGNNAVLFVDEEDIWQLEIIYAFFILEVILYFYF